MPTLIKSSLVSKIINTSETLFRTPAGRIPNQFFISILTTTPPAQMLFKPNLRKQKIKYIVLQIPFP